MPNTRRLDVVGGLLAGLLWATAVHGATLLEGPCADSVCGKLVGQDTFSGKMLDHAALDTRGAGNPPRKIVNDSSGAVKKSSGGGRRIMWRQIQ